MTKDRETNPEIKNTQKTADTVDNDKAKREEFARWIRALNKTLLEKREPSGQTPWENDY